MKNVKLLITKTIPVKMFFGELDGMNVSSNAMGMPMFMERIEGFKENRFILGYARDDGMIYVVTLSDDPQYEKLRYIVDGQEHESSRGVEGIYLLMNVCISKPSVADGDLDRLMFADYISADSLFIPKSLKTFHKDLELLKI